MAQTWYVFTSSHISSTVIKTIMKLRKSSCTERSMVVSHARKRGVDVLVGFKEERLVSNLRDAEKYEQ